MIGYIYLKWTDTHESTIPLFDLEIFQEENNFAKARLVIDALTPLPKPGTVGIIKQENDEILFKGLLIGALTHVDGAFGELELIAKPLDIAEKINALQQKNRIHPYWDGLWIRSDKHDNFQEIQDVRTGSLYCDRRTGELALSNWFEGRQAMDLTQKFFPHSLRIKLVRQPLQACMVNVHAHWIQWHRDICNLGTQMKKAFPQRKVSTYTEKAIIENWPEPRKRLGRSGVWILKSELKPVIPASPLYPAYSPPIRLDLKMYRITRHWFKPILWVRWQKRQKRKETLSLTLRHDVQPLFPGEGEHKTLEYTLQNINPDPDCYAWEPDHFYRQGAKMLARMVCTKANQTIGPA